MRQWEEANYKPEEIMPGYSLLLLVPGGEGRGDPVYYDSDNLGFH